MTTGLLPLRPYQRDAVDKSLDALLTRRVEWPAGVLPTGAGKTVVFMHLGAEYLEQIDDPAGQIVVLAHREELLTQAADKAHSVAPHLSVGIVAAQRNEAAARIVCASVQTLSRGRRLDMIPRPRLLIVDEAHHAAAPTYQSVIGRMVERGAQVIGVTATMTRSDELSLGDTWKEVVFHRSIAEMISHGYLVRPRGIRVKVEDLDLAQVKRVHGDYSTKELGDAVAQSLAPEAITKAILERCPDRQGIIFAPTVVAATVIAAAVRDAGMSVAVVEGKTPPEERRAILEGFRAGRIQWLANCMVLTEGTDLPMAEVIVVARPTSSIGLYIQMIGRGLRPSPGKTEALILDVVGATGRHRLTSPIDLFGAEREQIEAAGLEPEDLLGGDLLPDDQTLLDELLGERQPDSKLGTADGALEFREVDLFRGSAMDWQQTYLGVWFLSAGDRYIVVQPGPIAGHWEVLDMHRTRRGNGRFIERDVPELGYALAWAEAQVTTHERLTASRDRSWKRKAATEKAIGLALRLGLQVWPGMRGGEVSSLIDQKLASDRIDRFAPVYVRAQI